MGRADRCCPELRPVAKEAHILRREEALLTRMRHMQEMGTGYIRGITGHLSLN